MVYKYVISLTSAHLFQAEADLYMSKQGKLIQLDTCNILKNNTKDISVPPQRLHIFLQVSLLSQIA